MPTIEGNNIAKRRKLLGLSQIELSRRAGLERTQVHNIETKYKSNSVGMISKVAKALGCKIDDLVTPENQDKYQSVTVVFKSKRGESLTISDIYNCFAKPGRLFGDAEITAISNTDEISKLEKIARYYEIEEDEFES